jgi:bifunctional UDP-N-acetylglucosamine pyrophosphorylase/glucosamine-1-phosphate N-acetyltransferase
MKAVVLCAGKGTRMRGITERTQKVLIPINGKPFLYYLMTNLGKAGYSEIALVVGYLKEQVEGFLKDYGFEAKLIEQREQLGTGHAILQAEEFAGGEDFVVMGGDNLWSVDDLKAAMKQDEYTYVVGLKYDDTEQYGVLVTDGEYLVDMPEKQKKSPGNVINTALYKFTNEVFPCLKRIGKSPRGEYEINDALKMLAGERKVKVMMIRNYWKDLGCPEDIPVLEDFLKGDW